MLRTVPTCICHPLHLCTVFLEASAEALCLCMCGVLRGVPTVTMTSSTSWQVEVACGQASSTSSGRQVPVPAPVRTGSDQPVDVHTLLSILSDDVFDSLLSPLLEDDPATVGAAGAGATPFSGFDDVVFDSDDDDDDDAMDEDAREVSEGCAEVPAAGAAASAGVAGAHFGGKCPRTSGVQVSSDDEEEEAGEEVQMVPEEGRSAVEGASALDEHFGSESPADVPPPPTAVTTGLYLGGKCPRPLGAVVASDDEEEEAVPEEARSAAKAAFDRAESGEDEVDAELSCNVGAASLADGGQGGTAGTRKRRLEHDSDERVRGRPRTSAIALTASDAVSSEDALIAGSHKKRKRRGRIDPQERVKRCMTGIAGKVHAPRTLSSTGGETPYIEDSVTGGLSQIRTHFKEMTGREVNPAEMRAVKEALGAVKRRTGQSCQWRAISLDDQLMYEVWLVLDPAYAVDSFLMGFFGHGETMGPRMSDYHVCLRLHHKPSPSTSGDIWNRFSGKNNGDARLRARAEEHAVHCDLLCGGAPWTESSAVSVDSACGIDPATRCGLCSKRRMFSLMDDDGTLGVATPAWRVPTAKAKLSFQKGAKPMAKKPDGSYNGAGWFSAKPIAPEQALRLMHTCIREVNRRRLDLDPKASTIFVPNFRVHSLRHGAVKNGKHLKVDRNGHAAHLCMSSDIYERKYGLEDATSVGEEVTGQVVNSRQRTQGAPAAAGR